MPSEKKLIEERKKPTCSMCTNHGLSSLKKKHKCIYDNEKHLNVCDKCKSTKNRRLLVAEDIKKYRMSENLTRIATELHPGRQRLQQLCRRCKIHKKEIPMNNHRRFCEFKFCSCVGCRNIENRCKEVNNEAKSKRVNADKPKQQPKIRQRQPKIHTRQPKIHKRQPKMQETIHIELPPFDQNFSQLINHTDYQQEVDCQPNQPEMDSVDLNLKIQSLLNYPILREGADNNFYALCNENNQEGFNEVYSNDIISHSGQLYPNESFSTLDVQFQDSYIVNNEVLVDQIEMDVNTWINQNYTNYRVEEVNPNVIPTEFCNNEFDIISYVN